MEIAFLCEPKLSRKQL